MDIFFKSEHFNQYFLCMHRRMMVFKVFQKLITTLYTNTIIYILTAFLKLLNDFENAYRNPPQNFLLCDCSLVPTSHWLQGKCARNNLSRAASGMILLNHKRLPVKIFSDKIVAVGSLKRVTGRIFKIS
jgi:hypothetical protein